MTNSCKPLRVLHVLPRVGLGGTEKVVNDLMQLQSSRHTLQLCNLEYSGSLRDVRGIARCIDRIKTSIRQFEPDVVHAHLWHGTLFGSFGATLAGIPCVAHVHDRSAWLTSGGLSQRAQRAMYRRLFATGRTRLVAVAESVKRFSAEHLRWPAAEIRVVHNGVRVGEHRAHRTNRECLLIGSAGRLVREKGFDVLIRAGAIMKSNGIDFQILIAGEGSRRGSLEELVQQLHLGKSVRFMGVVQNMQEFYAQLDLFVLPSFSEGLPMALLEAMALGLAAVASDVGGVSEVIENGIQGFIVPSSDPDALAGAILKLSRDFELRHRMGQNARQRIASSFTVERVARQVDSIYAELTN